MSFVRICLKYLSTTRDRTGRRQQTVEFPTGSRLADVIEWLNENHSFALPDPGIMVIVNGRGWTQLSKRLDHEINEDDIICLAPLVDGG